MADGLFTLVVLCIVMGTASFLAGILPLSFSLTSRQLRLITALGTGVLVGTSLIVIIPEGIEALYEASASSHDASHQAMARRWTATEIYQQPQHWRRNTIATGVEVGVPADKDIGFVTGPDDGFGAGEKGVELNAPSQNSETATGGPPGNSATSPHDDHTTTPHDAHPDFEPHVWVGLSLITGFILMYLIDTLPQHASPASPPRRFSISLNSLSSNLRFGQPSQPNGHIANPGTGDEDPYPSASTSPHSHSRPTSTTVGLVIHAAADGIALGASSTSTSNLSFIIFIALMIHKAPAAFGLTSVLLRQGLSKRGARAHLIVFSLAAPVGALLTFSIAHIFGYGSEYLGTHFTTGVLLLFSGGTFLYVAMHTMREAGGGEHGDGNGNGYVGVGIGGMEEGLYGGASTGPTKGQGSHFVDTLVTVGGMLLPLVTQFGHGH